MWVIRGDIILSKGNNIRVTERNRNLERRMKAFYALMVTECLNRRRSRGWLQWFPVLGDRVMVMVSWHLCVCVF